MKTSVSIYLATPMTGMMCDQIWTKSTEDRQWYEKEGIRVLSPVDGEGIPFESVQLQDRSDEDMHRIWKQKDKRAIRDANVLVYECPTRWSQGIAHELVLARGVLWKPTVYIGQGGFITREEDDLVCNTHREAASLICHQWGTRRKRIVWRLKMLFRCLPRWIWHQIREFK